MDKVVKTLVSKFRAAETFCGFRFGQKDNRLIYFCSKLKIEVGIVYNKSVWIKFLHSPTIGGKGAVAEMKPDAVNTKRNRPGNGAALLFWGQ